MSEANTTGRLKAFTTYAEPELRDEAGRTVAVLPYRWADARRMAACWNACQGIPTPTLEREEYLQTASYELRRKAEAERDALAAKLAEQPVNARLLAIATGKIQHIYSGNCPAPMSWPGSRDPECPACQVIIAAEAQQAWPARLAARIARLTEDAVLKPHAKGD